MRVAIQALAAILGGCWSPTRTRWTKRSRSLRSGRADRAPDPAGARVRIRCGGHRGSRSGGLPGRAPHARDRGCRGRLSGQDRRLGARCRRSRSCSGRSRMRPTATSKDRDARARVVVVNEFVTEAPPPAALFQPDPGAEARQAERLADLRRRRDRIGRNGPSTPWRRGARDRQSRAPAAVRADVTLGRSARGSARSSAFTAHRHSDPVRRTRLAPGAGPWSAPRLPRWPCLVPPAPRGRTCCRTWARPTRRWPRSW